MAGVVVGVGGGGGGGGGVGVGGGGGGGGVQGGECQVTSQEGQDRGDPEVLFK